MKLTALGIKKACDGRHGDGNGLELHKKNKTGKWIFRYSFGGKRREMGLGTWPTISLADARKERDKWALVLSQGGDPISGRRAQRDASAAELARRDPTLEELTNEVFEAYRSSLRKGGSSGRWMSPLKTHVFPKLGHRPISTIQQRDIHDALKPIWKTMYPTAEKAIQRLHIVFREGRLYGHQCDPFTIDAAKSMLGIVSHKTKHLASTQWQDIPELYAKLEGKGTSASCLQFMILTLVRAGGCRQARFDEFNGDIWTVPAERMKGKEGQVEDFRVPLSESVMNIIDRRAQLSSNWLFKGHRGNPISDSTLSKYMRDHGLPGTPHGFRTSFRTWVQDNDAAPFDVAETILAHRLGGKTERAYARSDLLERRRVTMLKWSAFVTGIYQPEAEGF